MGHLGAEYIQLNTVILQPRGRESLSGATITRIYPIQRRSRLAEEGPSHRQHLAQMSSNLMDALLSSSIFLHEIYLITIPTPHDLIQSRLLPRLGHSVGCLQGRRFGNWLSR
jgi:hypothetical protein